MKLVILLASFLLGCAAAHDGSQFIIGGEDAPIEEFPWMARILHLGQAGCGGTIVNARSVLTAAHCIFVNTPALVSFFVGTSDPRGAGGQTYRALRITIHPDYVFTQDPNLNMVADLAIIRSISSIQFSHTVQPIALGTSFVSSGSNGRLSGWGLMGGSLWRDQPDKLQQLSMTSISNTRCSLLHRDTPARGVISSEKLCFVGGENAGGCRGDPGSPIVRNGVVVGILSWMMQPCGSHPTVFIRVAHHLAWIQQHV